MELKEFVKESLVQIDQGILEADKEIDRGIFYSGTSDNRSFEFDIAVMTKLEKGRNAKGEIKVVGIGDFGGKFINTTTNTSVSRIKFGVHFANDGNPNNKKKEIEEKK